MKMGWAGHVTSIRQTRHAHNTVMRKHKRFRHKQKDNFKMDIAKKCKIWWARFI